MPVANTVSLTTIGNLYDMLATLFSEAHTAIRKPKGDLQRIRPSDDDLGKYFSLAVEYFTLIARHVTEIREFLAAENTEPVVTKFRGSHGGSALFRPIGLEIFTKIVARLTKDMPLADAVQLASRLPRTLNQAPYANLMWDVSNQTISNAHKVTLREILLYMVGASKMTDTVLTERYRKETDNKAVKLPAKII